MEKAIQKLLSERYFLNNENSWDDIAKRVSGIYPEIYELIKDKIFLPSTPTLMNANTKGERKGTLSSCFTMGIDDSIEGIFEAVKEAAIVTKAGGGVGYDFTTLRGNNENIKSIAANSSGPLPFMNVFNSTLDGIMQGGKRRGAGMGMLRVDHPNILNFIRIKSNKGQMERLNLSVKLTDKFYQELKENPNKIHQVKLKTNEYIDLIDDDGKPVTVKKLWDEIVEYAWRCAEPGIINEDIAFRQCTVTNLSNQILTNPCSEFVNIPFASCNLGSVNLSKLVDENGNFAWKAFEIIVRKATRFLNNVIDVNDFPLDKIRETTLKIRPIGLGAMGYAHMLFKMKIPFNSPEALALENRIFKYLTLYSMDESCNIAAETGKTYPAYDYDLFMQANNRFFDAKNVIDTEHYNFLVKLQQNISKYGVANSCFTSIAPNGSIGYIADTTGGIEPAFALTYARKIEKLNKEYETVYITDSVFDAYLNENFDVKTKEKILAKVASNKGSCQNVEEIPEADRKVFMVASDLTPMEHLESLGIVARNTSLSVSKTINLPTEATREEIAEVYLKAHELGVIGVTVYRDGCREGVLVHNVDLDNNDCIVKTNAPKRPKKLPCHVYRVNILNRHNNESEKWIIFVGLLNDDPYEIFAGKIQDKDFDSSITEGFMVKAKKDGKKVYQFVHNNEVLVDDIQTAYLNELREYVTRLMSLALRHGAGIEYLKAVLQKSSGTIVDFDKAVIRAISKYVKVQASKERCPVCNADLIYVEGCVKCSSKDCYYSKCS